MAYLVNTKLKWFSYFIMEQLSRIADPTGSFAAPQGDPWSANRGAARETGDALYFPLLREPAYPLEIRSDAVASTQ
jgi:hypothetical protein